MAPTSTTTKALQSPAPSNKKRPYDIILFGATGDTGRCVAHFLHNKGALLGIQSWTLAARNSTKINTMFEPILSLDSKSNKSNNGNGIQCGTPIIADCNDYASLLTMASQATIILTCAGPFTTYGETLLKACIESSTHYVDITGETPWVNQMAATYGEEAKSKGLYMISQAAYDSVPSDLTVALAAEMVGEDCNYVETHHELRGGSMPVGTVNTILNVVLGVRRSVLAVVTGGLVGGATAEEQRDQLRRDAVLGKGGGLVPKHVERSVTRDMIWNNILPYSSLAESWSFPHFMAVANIPIVHTTADSLGYGVSAGKGFTYRERFTFSSLIGGNNMKGSFLVWVGFMILILGVGGGLILPLGIPAILFFPDTTSRLIQRWIAYDLGSVKRITFRHLCNGYLPFGFTKCVALASNGCSGRNNVMASVSFEGDYDAGLGFTALSVTTVAAAILKRIADGKEGKGFDTAVAAIGPGALRDEYEMVGIRIDCKLNGKL